MRDLYETMVVGWHADAACRGSDIEFIPDAGNYDSPMQLLPLLICPDCPVRRQCLEDALTPRLDTSQQWVMNPGRKRSSTGETFGWAARSGRYAAEHGVSRSTAWRRLR